MREDPQQCGFSITNLLTTPNPIEQQSEDSPPIEDRRESLDKGEDNSSTRTSSSVSPLSSEEREPLAGMLGFNPLLMQQMAQSAAAFALQSKVKPSTISPMESNTLAKSKNQSSEVPTTSANNPNTNPEWYNAMNYLNMASRQLQFMSGSQAGWNTQLGWLNPYVQKSGQHKRKGGQIRFTNEQTDALEHTFDNNKYLSNVQRRKLAKSLSLSERQVKTWFQNRRAKWRRVRKDGEDEEDLAHSLIAASSSSSAPQLLNNNTSNGSSLYHSLSLANQAQQKNPLFGLFKSD